MENLVLNSTIRVLLAPAWQRTVDQPLPRTWSLSGDGKLTALSKGLPGVRPRPVLPHVHCARVMRDSKNNNCRGKISGWRCAAHPPGLYGKQGKCMQVGRLFTQAVLKFGYRNASPS